MSISPDLADELRKVIDEDPSSLEAISPEEATEKFLDYKKPEIRSQTITEYRRKLSHFVQFCEEQDLENLNELNGRKIDEYQKYRRLESSSQNEPLSANTMRDDMYLIREFIKYLESIEAARSDLANKIRIPKMGEEDGVRDIEIKPDRIENILDHLEKYEYASKEHVVWVFHTYTGRRPGGLYALDVSDLYLNCDDPYLKIKHRQGETELKNGKKGETEIGLTEDVAQVFKDYIETQRIDITTENGREPFLTSRHGRLSKTTMRKYVYKYSCPCVISGDCPHGKNIETCEAAQNGDTASQCPSSEPPYSIRHGHITARLRKGVPAKIVGERCDVSEKVIDKHYDERTETEKREQRQELMQQIRNERDSGGYL